MGKRKQKNTFYPLFPDWERVNKQRERDGFTPHHKDVFVSFSGGKDSVSSYILACQLYPKSKIHLIFTETGDENPETYDYCRWFHANVHPITRLATRVTGRNGNGRIMESVPIDWNITIDDMEAQGLLTVFDEIRERHASNPDVPPYPADGIRFCTQTLKVRCFGRYVKEEYPTRESRVAMVVVLGLRRLESHNRANTPYFAYDLDNGWDIWYPVFDYTTAEVFELHLRHNIRLSPIYEYRERSNCKGCAFSTIAETKATIRRHGIQAYRRWIELEAETGYTVHKGISLLQIAAEVEAETESSDLKEEIQVETISCNSGFCEVA